MQPIKPTYRTRLFAFFDEQGTADFTTAELVARFGCSSNVAGRYRKQWKEQHGGGSPSRNPLHSLWVPSVGDESHWT